MRYEKKCECGFVGSWNDFNASRCKACHKRKFYAKTFAKNSYKRFYGRWPTDSEAELSIGCTFDELHDWIVSNWESWMGWHNNGNRKGNWSLDHVQPISPQNRSDSSVLHFSNLMPVEATFNATKGDLTK